MTGCRSGLSSCTTSSARDAMCDRLEGQANINVLHSTGICHAKVDRGVFEGVVHEEGERVSKSISGCQLACTEQEMLTV